MKPTSNNKTRKVNRREFVETGVMGLIGLGALGAGIGKASAQTSVARKQKTNSHIRPYTPE